MKALSSRGSCSPCVLLPSVFSPSPLFIAHISGEPALFSPRARIRGGSRGVWRGVMPIRDTERDPGARSPLKRVPSALFCSLSSPSTFPSKSLGLFPYPDRSRTNDDSFVRSVADE